MKKSITYILLFSSLFISSCNKTTKEAQARLDQAKALFAQDEFAAAKTEIDSLRTLYPKEFKVLKEGLTLMRQVEMKEAIRNIAYVDSLLPIRQQEAEVLAKAFTYEKDSIYEETGNYIYKQQTIERNLERCYIRAGVNERGEYYLSSVYNGTSPINHTNIKLSTKEDIYVETAIIPFDGGVNYRFENLGRTTEVVTYKGENGLDALQFIAEHQKERIKVNFQGGKSYIIYIADGDKKAIAATYEFALVLGDIDQLSKEKNKSLQRIDYLKRKVSEEE